MQFKSWFFRQSPVERVHAIACHRGWGVERRVALFEAIFDEWESEWAEPVHA